MLAFPHTPHHTDSLVILPASLARWVMLELLSFQCPARSNTVRSLTVIMAILGGMISFERRGVYGLSLHYHEMSPCTFNGSGYR